MSDTEQTRIDRRDPVLLKPEELERLYGACADNPMLYTYVVLLAETGSRSRSEALGHSSITTTMMYTHLVRENLLDLPGVQPVNELPKKGPRMRNQSKSLSRKKTVWLLAFTGIYVTGEDANLEFEDRDLSSLPVPLLAAVIFLTSRAPTCWRRHQLLPRQETIGCHREA